MKNIKELIDKKNLNKRIDLYDDYNFVPLYSFDSCLDFRKNLLDIYYVDKVNGVYGFNNGYPITKINWDYPDVMATLIGRLNTILEEKYPENPDIDYVVQALSLGLGDDANEFIACYELLQEYAGRWR